MYKTILFVEDEQSIAEIYADILRASGYEVDLAFDGNTGLAKAQAKRYDLILLDLMLPHMSGTDILRALKNKQKTPNFSEDTDVIILTNFDVDDIEKQEILTMAQAYLIKVNTTPKSLLEKLNEMSAKKQKPSSTAPAS